jgi:cytochrome c oxidase subunit III
MATTVHEPPKIEGQRGPSQSHGGFNGGGQGVVPGNGNLPAVKHYSPPPASTGIWVVLASITMTFAAFTSALIVRQGSALDWRHLTLPNILYVNTLVLFASSFALEMARRRLRVVAGGLKAESGDRSRWLYVALFLGLLFVVGQYVAWAQLRAQGLYLATNPNSSFFYVLTAVHALHVLGGLGGLLRVIRKMSNSTLRKSTLDATAYYWHFMDGLWVYLLVLLWMKL